jgi:ribonuclease-3
MKSTYNFSEDELQNLKYSNSIDLQNHCYEELEFYGDSILDFMTVLYITERFPSQSEGFYTKLKSKIVNGTSLSKLAKKLDFHQFLLISQQVEEKFGRFSEKILEDIFEAFIGALFRDQPNKFKGFSVCSEFIHNILNNVQHDFDYAELILYDNNYKDQLLRYYNTNKLGHPLYKEISVEESTNMKIFTIGIVDPLLSDQFISTAVGSTKKKAEQLAAKDALRKFGVLIELL